LIIRSQKTILDVELFKKEAAMNDCIEFKNLKTEIGSSDDEGVDVGVIKTQPNMK
jgi:hypothetical protein